MRSSLTLYAAALASALLSSGTQAEVRYRVLNLGVPEAYGDPALSLAFALNEQGAVAGTVADPQQHRPARAFLYQDGRMRLLGDLGGLPTSEAVSINDRGQVLGYAVDPRTSERRLFLYDQGRLTDLSTGPEVNDRTPHALNDAGQVVGAIHSRAFILDGKGLRFIPFGADVSRSEAQGINDRGVVVGHAYVESESAYRAFVWDGTRPSYLPWPGDAPDTTRYASAMDINEAGQIAVNVGNDAYLYGNGSFQPLGALAGPVTEAMALNDKGWVVGVGTLDYNPHRNGHAVLFHDGVLHDLNDLLTPVAARQWSLDLAMDINDRGQIVGLGTIGGQQRAFLATPVPESGTLALLLAGLGGVGIAVRRRGGGGTIGN